MIDQSEQLLNSIKTSNLAKHIEAIADNPDIKFSHLKLAIRSKCQKKIVDVLSWLILSTKLYRDS